MEDENFIEYKIYKPRVRLTKEQKARWKEQRKQPFITMEEGEWYRILLQEPNPEIILLS